MEMAGRPETAMILDALNATRASARERQDELERKIRDEARKLRQGVADGVRQHACLLCRSVRELHPVDATCAHVLHGILNSP